MLGWFCEFFGCFVIAILSLLAANYYFHQPRSPLAGGLVSAIIVFIVVTPLLYIGNGKPLLNPASTVVSGVQGKITGRTVLTYIVAQLLGFFAGFAFFTLLLSPRVTAT